MDDFSGIRSPTSEPPHPPVWDARALRDVVEEGVYRGVLKAVAVYALISLLIWAIVSIVGESTRYG